MSPQLHARALSIDPVPKGTIYHEERVDPRDPLKQKPRKSHGCLPTWRAAEVAETLEDGPNGPHDELGARTGGERGLITQRFYAPAPAPPAVSDAATIMPKPEPRRTGGRAEGGGDGVSLLSYHWRPPRSTFPPSTFKKYFYRYFCYVRIELRAHVDSTWLIPLCPGFGCQLDVNVEN